MALLFSFAAVTALATSVSATREALELHVMPPNTAVPEGAARDLAADPVAADGSRNRPFTSVGLALQALPSPDPAGHAARVLFAAPAITRSTARLPATPRALRRTRTRNRGPHTG